MRPCCPRTCYADQAGNELRDPPDSVSQVLELKVCALFQEINKT